MHRAHGRIISTAPDVKDAHEAVPHPYPKSYLSYACGLWSSKGHSRVTLCEMGVFPNDSLSLHCICALAPLI